MKPSYHPHSTHPDISPSQHVTCDVAAAGVAEATGFARDPPSRAHPSYPPARQTSWPYRVHFRLGLVFRLAQLPTTHRCAAVALGYPSVPRPRRTQTFTGWFHGFISARSAEPQLGKGSESRMKSDSPSWGLAFPEISPAHEHFASRRDSKVAAPYASEARRDKEPRPYCRGGEW